MEEKRPIGVILYVIWSLIAGVAVILYGWALWDEGTRGLAPGVLGLPMWVPYFKTYVFVGVLWVIGGAVCCVSALALLNGVEGGRKVNIISVIAISIGWIIIKYVSYSFALPLPLIGIIIALPMLYLWTRQVRDYCAKTTGLKPT